MSILQEEVTIVLQGSTLGEYNGTRCINLAVNSIRKVMPKCKIIVSTWKGEELPENLDVNKVVYSDDPGFETRDCTPEGKPNNVNRQIVSSINGLKQVETKYAMKTRTDFLLKNTRFLKLFDKYNEFDENYRIFEKRILCLLQGTRKPRARNFNLPFHIADPTTFGLTTDLIKLYDIRLVTEEEFKWFIIHTEFMPDSFARNKFGGEQSIWINCLEKHGVDVKCKYCTHVDDEIAEQSDRYLANNFYPISYKNFGQDPLKKIFKAKVGFHGYSDFYTTHEWLKLYKKYCDKNVFVNPFNFERQFINVCLFVDEHTFPKFIKNLFRHLRGDFYDA